MAFYVQTLLLVLALGANSCGGSDDPAGKDPELTVSETSINVDFSKQTKTIRVTCNADWGAAVDGAPDWVKLSPSGGVSGTTELKVSVEENKNRQERSASIIVRSGSVRKEVSLTQGFDENNDSVVPEGYVLVWEDEFDEGSVPDTDKWWYETGAGGWGNNEIQEYVRQKTPKGTGIATIEDGLLTISTVREDSKVYSIRMNTTEGWTYGWFEARIKVSDTPGSWPAFWMMPKNYTTWPGDGEIDIMEYAISTQGKNKSSSSIHCNAYNWPAGTQKTHVQSVPNAAGEFHVYALEWTAQEMNFYVDGVKHFTFKNEGKGYNVWPFDAPFYLKLNQAWGGNMGGNTDYNGLPAKYQIDYVRVFQKK